MLLTSILRTLVPALWGSLVAWLIGVVPVLAPLQAHLLGLSDVILPVITAVIIAAWYAFWRWLEPRLPDWLTRAVLGSAQAPVYPGKHVEGSQVPNVNPGTLSAFPSNITVTNAGEHITGDSTP
jgi:hypothetical protein